MAVISISELLRSVIIMQDKKGDKKAAPKKDANPPAPGKKDEKKGDKKDAKK